MVRVVGCLLAAIISTACFAQETLRSVAERKDLKIGVMALDATWNTPQQKSLVASEFNVVTVGAYWNRTHPARDMYDWSVTDAVVNWADGAGLGVDLHPLLYPANTHTPVWVQASPHAEALAILEEHISTAMTRYRGVVDVWDVVNEAVSPAGGYRDCWWLEALGPGYIVETFRLARQYDSDATLVYNDHDIELDNASIPATRRSTISATRTTQSVMCGWNITTAAGCKRGAFTTSTPGSAPKSGRCCSTISTIPSLRITACSMRCSRTRTLTSTATTLSTVATFSNGSAS